MSSIALFLTLATQSLLWQAVPLQIGDPAPPLTLGEFVTGEPITQLTIGSVYVIEFSGTTCVPCVKLMPHLNALQKRHPKVAIISVFPEEAKEVRKFLEKQDLKVAYRISVDDETKMWKHWSDAACQTAIPHAFIVGADGKIAWIGHAGLLDEPLAKIVSGTFDSRKDVQRLALEQGIVVAKRRREERAARARGEYDRLNQMVIRGEYPAALSGTLQAIQDYAGSDFEIELLRGLEVFIKVRVPAEQGSVLSMSQQYAIQSQLSGDPMVMYRCAAALVNAAGPEPPCKNQAVLDLAEAVLKSNSFLASTRKPDYSGRVLRFWAAQIHAQIFHMEGNTKGAFKVIEDTVAELEKAEKDLPTEDRRVMNPTTRSEAAELLKKYSGAPVP